MEHIENIGWVIFWILLIVGVPSSKSIINVIHALRGNKTEPETRKSRGKDQAEKRLENKDVGLGLFQMDGQLSPLYTFIMNKLTREGAEVVEAGRSWK